MESRRGFLMTAAMATGAYLAGVRSVDAFKKGFDLVPEYEKELKHALLSTGDMILEDEFDQLHKNIVRALPPQTKITLIGPKKHASYIEKKLVEYGRDVRSFKVVQVDMKNLQEWIRDWAIAVKVDSNGLVTLVVPNKRRWEGGKKDFNSGGGALLKKFANTIGATVIEAPFPFDGGNIMFDRNQAGQPRVLAGYSVLSENLLYRDEVETKQLPEVVLETRRKVLEKFFGAEVVIIGDEAQDEAIYHLDLAMVILSPAERDGKRVLRAAISWPDDSCRKDHACKRFIEQQARLENQLRSLGYQDIAHIQHSAKEIRGHYSSVNVVPFMHQGLPHMLMPVYAHQRTLQAQKVTLDADDITGTAKSAYDEYSKLGIVVHLIPDPGLADGGLHCKINQLASSVLPEISSTKHA